MKEFLEKLNINSDELIRIALTIVVIFILTFILTKIVNVVFKKLEKRTEKVGKPEAKKWLKVIRRTIVALLYFIAFSVMLSSIPSLKTLANSLLAGSGILALVVGFASQEAVSNMVSGMMIQFFKPFQVGDTIRFVDKNIFGTVEEISLRHTIIKTTENKRIIIPNGIINKETIENSNIVDERVNNYLEIGITYESNIDRAKEIAINEIKNHANLFDSRTPEEIKNGKALIDAKVLRLDPSSVTLRFAMWSKTQGEGFQMKCDLMESIKKAYDNDESVSMAYPHLVIVEKEKTKTDIKMLDK